MYLASMRRSPRGQPVASRDRASNQAHIRLRRSGEAEAIRAFIGRAVPYCSVAHRRRGRAA